MCFVYLPTKYCRANYTRSHGSYLAKLPGHAWECPGWVRKPANPGGVKLLVFHPNASWEGCILLMVRSEIRAKFTSWGVGSWNLTIYKVLYLCQVVVLGISEASTLYLPSHFPQCFLWPIIHTSSGIERLWDEELQLSSKNRSAVKIGVIMTPGTPNDFRPFLRGGKTLLVPEFLLEDGGSSHPGTCFKWWNDNLFVQMCGSSAGKCIGWKWRI